MIRPLPDKQVSKPPITGKHPDPQRVENLSRLGDEITEMAAHVETQVRLYRRVKRIEALQQENVRYAKRRLSLYEDDDGSWVIRGRLSPEAGALISKALDAAKEQLFEEQKQVPEEVAKEIDQNLPLDQVLPYAFESRHADALERVAEGFLAGTKSTSSGGDRYLVNIHTEVDTLRADGDGAINFSLPDGKVIPHGPDTRFSGNVVALRIKNREKGLDITPDTPIPKWYGEKMDHQMAVLGLLQRE